MQTFNQDTSQAILDRARSLDQANVFDGQTQKPFQVQSMTLALDTARLATQPLKIGFPFKSFFVQSATDTLVSVNLRPTTNDDFQSAIPIKQNDSVIFTNQISAAYLDWSAQSGKSITIIFFVDAEFRSGSQISVTGGGVTISEGSSFTNTQYALVAATPTLICAADSTRKNALVQNNSGAPIWLGGPSVNDLGANQGIQVAPGGSFIYKNTGALYAYSDVALAADFGVQVMKEY